jgi:hypothetical protein
MKGPVPRAVAVVLDGPPTPVWQACALRDLADSPMVDVVEVRLTGSLYRGFAQRLRAAIERHLFSIGADALASTRVEPRASSEPATIVVWLSERLTPTAESRDVLYLCHGHRGESAEEAIKRAVLDRSPLVETNMILQRADSTVVIERTASRAHPFSITLGRDLLLWKLVPVVRRAVERMPGLDLPVPDPEPASTGLPMASLTAHVASSWWRVLTIRLLFRRPWSIHVRKRGLLPTAGWAKKDDLVHWRAGHVYADPFLFEHDGRHHLFCEEVPLGCNRGVISHTELSPDGTRANPPEPILQRPYHLSYPFVFAHGGDVFMIPETLTQRRVELYRAVEFPHVWQHEAVIFEDVRAVDATVLLGDDRIWLFAGMGAAHTSAGDELYLFWTDEPRGPWHPHPHNPIVSDVRCARPGGAIQQWGSRLVRPGQDGSRRYGGALSFREIDVLSPTDYAEHEIGRLDPDDLGDGARATHSYASDGCFEAIDLRRRELRSRLLAIKLRDKLRLGAED